MADNEIKISEMLETEELTSEDVIPVVQNGANRKIEVKNFKKTVITSNAGAHNAIYRGKDITDLWYDGTLSEQIANGTFDNIFVGDYIIGKSSGNVYLVANLDYNYLCGDTSCTTHHLCLVPLAIMGSEQINTSASTSGGYTGSNLYTTLLDTYRAIIQADFGTEHILTVRRYLTNAVTSGYASGRAWCDSDIDLMNENMVYGTKIYTPMPAYSGSSVTTPNNTTTDKSQLAIFRYRADLIIAKSEGVTDIESTDRNNYWLRDVVSSTSFANVYSNGCATSYWTSDSRGIRPAFLIY